MIKVPIVFIIDKNFLPPAYIAISSLIDNALETTEYDIIVLYQGKISSKVELLKNIVEESRHNIIISDISELQLDVPRGTGYWPKIVYARLYLSQILSHYDRVIYSDVDVFFLRDLADVYETEMEGYIWGGVAAEKNSPDTLIHQYYKENNHDYIFWDGFMVMNLKEMREINWELLCTNNIKKYKDRLYMGDLEILNLTAKKIKKLPFRYVCLQSVYDASNIEEIEDYNWLSRIYSQEELEHEKENAVIIHYAGKTQRARIGKIWLRINPPKYYAIYMKQLPLAFKIQNNRARIFKNIKVQLKIILLNLYKGIG